MENTVRLPCPPPQANNRCLHDKQPIRRVLIEGRSPINCSVAGSEPRGNRQSRLAADCPLPNFAVPIPGRLGIRALQFSNCKTTRWAQRIVPHGQFKGTPNCAHSAVSIWRGIRIH
jgi:hypothetical protein